MHWQAEITKATLRTQGHIRRTPVIELAVPGVCIVMARLENLQHTGFQRRNA